MALISQNSEYIKADISNFKIENGEILVPLKIYTSKNERNFEKENIDNINQFKVNTENYINSLNFNIDTRLKLLCPQAVNPDDFSDFRSVIENDGELTGLRNKLLSIIEEYEQLKLILNGVESKKTFQNIDLFKSFGLNVNWLDNPIKIGKEVILNIGVYNNEDITGHYIYTLLKQKINNTVDDL